MDLRPGGPHTDGRKSLLTPERQATILAIIGDGGTQEAAARAAGISTSALSLWLEKGSRRRKGDRNADVPYREFASAYRKARRAGLKVREQRRAQARAPMEHLVALARANGIRLPRGRFGRIALPPGALTRRANTSRAIERLLAERCATEAGDVSAILIHHMEQAQQDLASLLALPLRINDLGDVVDALPVFGDADGDDGADDGDE